MIAWNALAQMLALGSVLVLQTGYMIAVARYLGPENFGRFSFIFSIIQMLLIGGDLGLHNAALREISGRLEESQLTSGLFFRLKLILTSGLLVGVFVLATFLPETSDTRVALAILGLGMFLHSLNLAINVVFQAHGKLYWASLNIFGVFLVQTIVGTAFLLMGGQLIAVAVAYLVATGVALIANFLLFESVIHPARIHRGGNWKDFVRKSWPVGLGTLFHTVSGRIGITLLALLAGAYPAGIYSAAGRIATAMSNVPIGIFSAVLPVMASFQGESKPVRRLFSRSLLLMASISVPFAVIFYTYAEPIILLIYGQQYSASVTILKILAWSLIPVFVGMAFSHVLLSQHQLVTRLPLATGLALITNLAANFVLIPALGARGAAYSLLISETLLAVAYAGASVSFLFRSRPGH